MWIVLIVILFTISFHEVTVFPHIALWALDFQINKRIVPQKLYKEIRYVIIHWNNKVFKEIPNKKIHWPKRDTHPKDTPDCGFDGFLSKTESKERKKK